MRTAELLRRQLDARLAAMPREQPPRGGWVRSIRKALGMTMAQLGRRLGVSAPAIAELEKRDGAESITVAKLRAAADALGCDLVVALVPRVPLREMVRQQAIRKVMEEDRRLLHTMALESQDDGVARTSEIDRAVDRWIDTRGSGLWD